VANRVLSLLQRGHAAQAVALLKPAIEAHPDAKQLRWLLIRAYVMDRNESWALRTLGTLAELDPDDCEPALWSGWIYLRQGALGEARESLASAACSATSPSATRRVLLLALIEQHAGRGDHARQHLEAVRRSERVYEEDRAALDHLAAALDPGYLAPLRARVELAAGWTANARAGSPVEPAASGRDDSSPLGQLSAWLRFVAPTGRWARPSVEAELRAIGYTAEAGRDFSYLELGTRPGLLLGDLAPNLLVAYRFAALLLAGGDRYEGGPLWFYNAHRAELEANLLPQLTLFGGAGRRLFREAGRSRVELDAGVGGSLRLHQRLRLLGALTSRWYDADKRAWDLFGGAALVSAEVPLPRSWALRLGALAGVDWYPRSAGYFDALAPATKRRDVLLRLSLSAFTPPLAGTRAGVTYEHSERFSTSAPFDFQDHRLLAKLDWSFTADPWAPRTVSRQGRVPLEHGLASPGFAERLQDLLRQDEAAQRSSACVQ